LSSPVVEGMISLSRVIKSQWAETNENEKRVIAIKVFEEHREEEFEPMTDIPEIDIQDVMNEAQLKAEEIVNEAREQAELFEQQMNEQRLAFELEKETILAQVQEDGYSVGLEEGRRVGYSEYHEIIQSARKVVESSKLDYRMHVDSSEREILDIGLKVASRILGEKLEDNEDEFLAIVRRALKEARDNQEVQLHVHPNYYDFLLANKEELLVLFPKEVNFYIYPNDEIAETACLIESEHGRIDASVDSQLEEMKRKLFELLEGE